jgi:hypothetical protein
MLHGYIDWRQRYITCPSQDLIYGFGMLDLAREPVVIQVPDFGGSFWVYQLGDLRTDGFGELGAMYGTKPGFYLAAGPDWDGTPPAGIETGFRAPTGIGYIIPRVFCEDGAAGGPRLQSVLSQIMCYPLRDFDGAIKVTDWTSVPHFPWVQLGEEEWRWVAPKTFFDVLPWLSRRRRRFPARRRSIGSCARSSMRPARTRSSPKRSRTRRSRRTRPWSSRCSSSAISAFPSPITGAR